MSLNIAANHRPASRQIAADGDVRAPAGYVGEALSRLRAWFGIEFHLFDAATGEIAGKIEGQATPDASLNGPLCCAVAERGTAELLVDDEPLLVLAIPIADHGHQAYVAVGNFVTGSAKSRSQLERAAERLSMSSAQAEAWIAGQNRWMPHALLSMGQLAAEKLAADRRLVTLEAEVRDVSLQLSTSYEEISLLYRLTQHLKLSSNGEELGRMALEWLADVLPAESLAIQLVPTGATTASGSKTGDKPVLFAHGQCPIHSDELTALVEHFNLRPGQPPLIVNPPVTLEDSWQWPLVRQLVVVSLHEGENCFGWLAAFNHAEDTQFGSVEASLLNSVGAILGIHRGNTELYRQQREFFAGMVRALTSAIDAKDPYTCGHSDRVARVAVRLAEEFGCDAKQIETIYLSGLLHDVGKIGIDDNVLRKPGKLTPEEYEHIKTHAEIGYKILVDIKQLDDMLPVVLHHHEQWDGKGYPRGLAGDEIPFFARIMAVADSFDAMGSDRPYRQGMCDEKLDAIMRDGAGKQWDAAVVDAFFRARDDIRTISREPVKRITLELRGQAGEHGFAGINASR